MSSEESFFPDLACNFFLFLYLCHSPATCYSWVLFLKQKVVLLKQKVVHCVLSFWLACVMLRSYMLMLFPNLWISSQIEPDVTLCYHYTQTLELVQTKNSMSSHSLDFALGYWIWAVKYKANYFGWKNSKKELKLTKLWLLKSLSLDSFMKKVAKSLFSFPVY